MPEVTNTDFPDKSSVGLAKQGFLKSSSK